MRSSNAKRYILYTFSKSIVLRVTEFPENGNDKKSNAQFKTRLNDGNVWLTEILELSCFSFIRR